MIDMRRMNLRSTSLHEAGHAVIALKSGILFSKTWILQRSDNDPLPQDSSLGQLTRPAIINKPDFVGRLDAAKAEAIVAFSGPIAECLAYTGMQPDWDLNKNDYFDARSFIRFATTPFTVTSGRVDFDLKRTETLVNTILIECVQTASQRVNDNEDAIRKVASALLDRWELTQAEVEALCL